MDFTNYLPDFLQQSWHGMSLWAWLLLPVRFIASYAVAVLAGRVFMASTRFVFLRRPEVATQINMIIPPIELMAGVILFKAARQLVPLGEQAIYYVHLVELLAGSFASGWLCFRLADMMGRRMEISLGRKGRRQAVAIIPLLRRLMKGAIAVLTLLFLLQNLGFNVSAMLAGLGIGGVAIALASQKTVENLFGGVMLVLDQPIRVGDFGIFDKYVGTIEDIGLRSTRIRTLDRTIVTVPNGDFSQLKLESFTARDQLLFKQIIGLTYNTSTEAMTKVLSGISELLKNDKRILPGFHVRLINFNASSLDVELFSYVNTNDWDRFLAIREELMLRIIGIVTEAGSGFAFPSQTLYVSPDKGTEEALSRIGSAVVMKEVLQAEKIGGAA